MPSARMIPDYEVSVLSGDIGLEQKEFQDDGWHDGWLGFRLWRVRADRHDPQPGDHGRRDRGNRAAGGLAGSQGRRGGYGEPEAGCRPVLAPRDPAGPLRPRRNQPRAVPADTVRSELRRHGERTMMGLGMGVGLLLMLLFWGLLVAGAVWLAKGVFSGRERPTVAPGAPEPNPREVLDQRYARGEITREEYELIRADLAL